MHVVLEQPTSGGTNSFGIPWPPGAYLISDTRDEEREHTPLTRVGTWISNYIWGSLQWVRDIGPFDKLKMCECFRNFLETVIYILVNIADYFSSHVNVLNNQKL